MDLGYHQRVPRCSRHDVQEGDGAFALVDPFGSRLAGDDPTEEAVVHVFSSVPQLWDERLKWRPYQGSTLG